MSSVMQRADQPPPTRIQGLTRVFSTFTATNPSIYLDIDRRKAQALGVNVSDIFTALQATLGGIYVNNFNLYGRTWQVNVQGEAARPLRHLGRSGRSTCATSAGHDGADKRRSPASRSLPARRSSPATTIIAR